MKVNNGSKNGKSGNVKVKIRKLNHMKILKWNWESLNHMKIWKWHWKKKMGVLVERGN